MQFLLILLILLFDYICICYEEVAAVVSFADGFLPAPRLTLKYQPAEFLALRANGGRGIRRANPVTDNFGILSTGKAIGGSLTERPLEDSWTFGGNATVHFTENTYLSLDFFRTQFNRQLLAYREDASAISLYSLDGHESWSKTYQGDFSTEPVERLTFTLTARYTDARACSCHLWFRPRYGTG